MTPPSRATAAGRAYHGSAATYHLEYGTSTGYGASTPETAAGAGAIDLTVTNAVTGLRPSTTYHVRAVATDTGSGVTRSQFSPAPTDAVTRGRRRLSQLRPW